MTLSRRSTIKAIGVVGTGSAITGTALAINEHEDDEREADETTADDEELGAIRVGHFSPDAPNVDVYVDDQQILSDVGYGDLSPYLEIVPGTYSIAITAAGDDQPVYEGTIAVDSEFYTAAALGELQGGSAAAAGDDMDVSAYDAANDTASNETGNVSDGGSALANETDGTGEMGDIESETDAGTFDVLLLVDSPSNDVEEGTAPLRVVHAVPDAPAVDIAEGETGALVFEDVAFTEPSGYVPVEPGSQTLELFPAGESAEMGEETSGTGNESASGNETDGETVGEVDVISQPDPVVSVELDLEADTAYTAFAIGYLAELDDETVTAEQVGSMPDETDDEDRSFSVLAAVDGEPGSETAADDDSSSENESVTADDTTEANESTDDAMNQTDGHAENESATGDY
ncbi:DUF4397 domain-containing protein [Haloterrigena salifodinae]|uniref:DUF4397 domain-containing protein n=1 Tax=Haloterrigena salifodinae TaxID=2675099 RepID=UPI000F86A09F|nr:DUF4397 domain-containing protein [Haloterrigena salifodinae]